jgi:molybdopterin synthase sulfur carrier subunit
MAVTVKIPAPLQKLTRGKTELSCNAINIQELVDAREKGCSDMKEKLTEEGKIRRFILV